MDYKNELGNWEEIILEPSGDTLPIGAITQFSGSIAPTNWLFCNGQAISRTEYSELFAIIGTHYGEGDGSTTFNLPDFIGRVPVGLDAEDPDFDALGDFGGEKNHTLTIDEMPNHNHVLKFKTSGSQPLEGNHGAYLLAGTSDTAIDSTGGDQPHNIMQPYLVTNFIIKVKQSVGIVGTVTNDIDDPNVNAVPNARTIKASVDEKIATIGKLLWAGYFTTGSITVPDISKYTLIAINVAGVLCLGNQQYGGCTFTKYHTLETTSYGYRYTYDSTNETLTVDEFNTGATDGATRQTITEIYGIF